MRKGLLISFVSVIVLFVGGLAWAAIPDSNTNVFTGCVGPIGQLRVIDFQSGDRCKSVEQQIQWNQSGPAGPPGLTGAAGPAGSTGPQGPSGPGVSGSYFVGVTDDNFLSGSYSQILRPQCNAGDFATGGGFGTANSEIGKHLTIQWSQMLPNNQDVPIGWDLEAFNGSSNNGNIHAYVVCIHVS